jgi:uncharacterized protein (TIGR03086 family)
MTLRVERRYPGEFWLCRGSIQMMDLRTSLIDEALSYAARSVLDVTPALLACPTPCRGWNLDMLLRHTSESLAALHDGVVTGSIGLIPSPPDHAPAAAPAGAVRAGAGRLLAARATTGHRRQVLDVGDLPLPAVALECAGAIEIAVHGWDISRACGQRRPVPESLAIALLAVAPLLIPEGGRHPLFGPPVAVTARASPGDRLVAFLGREPGLQEEPASYDVTARRQGYAEGEDRDEEDRYEQPGSAARLPFLLMRP